MKIAYIVWNIPTVATFVVAEIKNVILKGIDVVLLPVKINKTRNIQKDYEVVYSNVQNIPYIFSFKLWLAIFYFLFTAPFKLFFVIGEVIASNINPPIYFLKTVAIIPKSIYYAYYIKKNNYNYLFGTWAHYPTTIAYIIYRLTRVPFAFSAHAGADIYRFTSMLKKKIEKAEFVTTCVAANKVFLDEFSRHKFEHKIYVNYHGVDLSKFKSSKVNSRCNSKVIKLISVGNLHTPKGFIYMIRALRLLIDQKLPYNFNYTIVGNGYEGKNISTEIKNLSLQDNVDIVGIMPHDLLIELYHQSDIFIMPSIISPQGGRDGIPNVLVEALSMGIPCIGTNVSGLPEAIIHGETGLLVNPQSPEELSNAVVTLLNDKNLRIKLSLEGPKHVQKYFDRSKNFEELFVILRKHFN